MNSTFTLRKTFSTRAPATARVAAVAAMFGIGLDEADFAVLQDVTIPLGRGQVVYITGQSGSGKSVLLRELAARVAERGGGAGSILDLNAVRAPADRALVDCFDEPLDETLRLLSLAGLNDAFLFLRRPGELSDGQQYRLRLALALAARPDVVFIDEFCSTLDRITARIIAHQIRRFATATGTTFVVATAHDDLYDDLLPDLYLEQLFGTRVAVSTNSAPRQAVGVACTVLEHVRIEPAGKDAWDALSQFHYRGHALPPHSHIFAATVPSGMRLGEVRRAIGVIVYGYPSLANRLRDHATGGRYLRFRSRRQMARALNREVRTISRAVVDPQYRGLGLAVRLVRETMPLIGTPYVEALATMARVNPFFERAGMTRYDSPPPPGAARLIAALDHCRIPQAVACHPAAMAQRIEQLDQPRRAFLWHELDAWTRRYESAKTSKQPKRDRDHLLNTAAKHLFGHPVYYLWKNNDIAVSREDGS